MENPRIRTARDNDDSDIIDNAGGAPDKTGREGGNLQRDVGTRDELARVDKPETHTRVTKADDIENDARYPKDRRGDM
ncbi:hypothetical protein [Sphingosinithalassobacter sp. LHW66-3]|uniref:hypothetical protein n=1 Tax=Sphingosinithalassobacter sp. LHW66-3 TaxID=3424718 RepID=UPI003D6C0607